MNPIQRSFFARPTLEVAPELLGMRLWSRFGRKETSGIIVEVEAYHQLDEASHSYRGPTKRNEAMFREGGHLYVYLIYGMHYCMNVVTETAGSGAAVLIRALEPLDGLELMRERRGARPDRELANGPAKLCEALGVGPELQGEDLLASPRVGIEPCRRIADSEIAISTRVGITKAVDAEWRFYLRGSEWVSKGRPSGRS